MAAFFQIANVPGQTEDRYHQGWFDVLFWRNSGTTLYVVLPFQPGTAQLHQLGKMNEVFASAAIDDRSSGHIQYSYLHIIHSASLGMVDDRLAESFTFESTWNTAPTPDAHQYHYHNRHSDRYWGRR